MQSQAGLARNCLQGPSARTGQVGFFRSSPGVRVARGKPLEQLAAKLKLPARDRLEMMRLGDAGLAFHEQVASLVPPSGRHPRRGFCVEAARVAGACCPCMFRERPRLLNNHAAIRPRSSDD